MSVFHQENSFVLSNGDTILLNNGEARLGPRIHVEDIYVDGNDISWLIHSCTYAIDKCYLKMEWFQF